MAFISFSLPFRSIIVRACVHVCVGGRVIVLLEVDPSERAVFRFVLDPHYQPVTELLPQPFLAPQLLFKAQPNESTEF